MSNGDLPLDIFRVAGTREAPQDKEKHLNGEFFRKPKIKNYLPERFRRAMPEDQRREIIFLSLMDIVEL